MKEYEDRLRDLFRDLDETQVKYFYRNKEKMFEVVCDILRDKFRQKIDNELFYQAYLNFKDCIKIVEDVFNESDYNGKDYTQFSITDAKVFISHFTANDKEASDFQSFLEFYNIDVFTDHNNGGASYGGEDWENGIEKEVKDRQFFVLLSKKISPSLMIKNEIQWFSENTIRNKIRFDLILEVLDNSNLLEYDINNNDHNFRLYEHDKEKCFNAIFIKILNKPRDE